MAAQSGLTIPLSITLSDFKLSGFVILVFSKKKGLTIVFRNDPLESLKVSSTFDSISFVREYLQKTIEDQLRNLFMEELPAIIHRLSLKLWCPDQLPKDDEDTPAENEDLEAAIDPLATPPLDPVDAHGNLLDTNDIANLTLNGGSEMPALFSQKNLLKLATLQDSQKTLSLFTPGIKTALWRATAGWDRPDPGSTPATPNVTKTYSFSQGQTHSVTSYTFSDTSSATNGHLPTRPSLASLNSGIPMAGSPAARSRSYMGGRKQKRRVVRTPLRKSKAESASVSEESSEAGETCTDTASVEVPSSEPVAETSIPEESEDVAIPDARFHAPSTKSDKTLPTIPLKPYPFTLLQSEVPSPNAPSEEAVQPPVHTSKQSEKMVDASERPLYRDRSDVLAQAWINKMASEIARRVYEENGGNNGFWTEQQPDIPPPAYEAS